LDFGFDRHRSGAVQIVPALVHPVGSYGATAGPVTGLKTLRVRALSVMSLVARAAKSEKPPRPFNPPSGTFFRIDL